MKKINKSKKEALVQIFFSEFWKEFKNMFFTEHFRTTAFELPAVLAIWISVNICFHCFLNLSKCNYDRPGARDVVNFFFLSQLLKWKMIPHMADIWVREGHSFLFQSNSYRHYRINSLFRFVEIIIMRCFAWFDTICTINKTWKTPMEEWYFSLQLYLKYHSSMGVFHVF